jgi:hypothetical protein
VLGEVVDDIGGVCIRRTFLTNHVVEGIGTDMNIRAGDSSSSDTVAVILSIASDLVYGVVGDVIRR